MPSTEHYAYLAGLLDGEGSIGLTSRGKRKGYSVSVVIYGCDPAIMVWLELIFGGSLYVGKQRNPKWRIGYAWSANNVRELLTNVRPFLVAKATQADLVLAYIDSAMPARSGRKLGLPSNVVSLRDEIAARLSALNKRGSDAFDVPSAS